MFMGSVCQEFRKNTAEMACLCLWMSGVSARKTLWLEETQWVRARLQAYLGDIAGSIQTTTIKQIS